MLTFNQFITEKFFDGYEVSKITEDAPPLDKPTLEPEALAKKHNVSVQDIEQQLTLGIEVEQEHTSNKELARQIALDHLAELPDYYTRLQQLETMP